MKTGYGDIVIEECKLLPELDQIFRGVRIFIDNGMANIITKKDKSYSFPVNRIIMIAWHDKKEV